MSACQPITSDISGKIALIDLDSECELSQQVLNAQAAGAKGAIICPEASDQSTFLLGFPDEANEAVVIPVWSI